MSTRLLELAEDAIAFCGGFVGIVLVLHVIERIAHGLAMNGAL